jgi:NADPH:quinone reductase-like Zn-dependent oxidoreductase
VKAFVYSKYGAPDVLELRNVEKPVPAANEVLINVRATSVNASDWEFLTGKPFYARIFGLFRPGFSVLGSDIAGVVEAVGSEVTEFQPDDEVLGDIMRTLGGFAEYVCASEDVLAKGSGVSFAEAATLPQAATVALQAVRDKGKVGEGHRVLINGAGGSVGTFAVQLAKWYGAEVFAVDHGNKLEMLRSIGADRVIDYTNSDFSRMGERFDFILDVVGNRSISDLRRSLTACGAYSVVGGRVLGALFGGSVVSLISKKSMGILAWKPNRHDLELVVELCKQGIIRPVIDARYELAELPIALSRLGARETQGIGVVVQAFDERDRTRK